MFNFQKETLAKLLLGYVEEAVFVARLSLKTEHFTALFHFPRIVNFPCQLFTLFAYIIIFIEIHWFSHFKRQGLLCVGALEDKRRFDAVVVLLCGLLEQLLHNISPITAAALFTTFGSILLFLHLYLRYLLPLWIRNVKELLR